MKVDLIFQYGKSQHKVTKEFPCRVIMDDLMNDDVINEEYFPVDFPRDKRWIIETCWFHFERGKICQTAILYVDE